MDSVRRSMRRIRVKRQVLHLDREMNEFQENLNEFQASFRRRESIRWRNGNKKTEVSSKSTMEKEIKHKMSLEDSVSLGSTRLIAVSKSETQILEASQTLLLSSTRLQSLKEELSLVKQGLYNPPARHRLAEVSLSNLSIPLVWKQSEPDLCEKKKFAVFCLISCGTQIFDTTMKIVDRNCTDLSFPEILVFSNLSNDFELKLEVYSHQLREESGRTSPSALMKTLREKLSGKKRKTEAGKAIEFRLVTTKVLTVEDSSGEVESLQMERSSCSSSSLASLHLFGQLVCRLAVSPYTRWEPLRTGSLEVARGGNYQQSFARLGNWALQIWPSRAAFRRGEEPSRAVRIDGSTRVIQGEETFTVQTEGEAELELAVAAEDGENAAWVGDIREHMEDWQGWHQAATSQMEILSPSRKEVERKKMRRKSASKIMMLYNRVSCNDLMEFNLKRNERILRNRN